MPRSTESSPHEELQPAGEATCELCHRSQLPLTRHHLIPQSRHNKARTRRQFDRSEMKTSIALLCRPCHAQVHALLDNATLSQHYHTTDALAGHPDLARFAAWVGKKPAGLKITIHRSRQRDGGQGH